MATAVPTTIPAPVGGWNARDALADMPAIDCVLLENFFPSTESVVLRPGSLSHATELGTHVETLMPYSGGATQRLFAATSAGIYNVTSSGAVGAVALAATNGRWAFTNFTNSGGSWLVAVNGVDKLALYNGTTWASIDGVSVPAITGVTTSTLSSVLLWKRRLWFAQKNTLSGWYLATDAIAGAAVKFDFGPIFTRGGYIVTFANWTLDAGEGSDDLFVIITSEGELAVYAGTDPSDIGTFSLIGVYYVGSPVGARCWTKFGSDVLYLSEQGLVELSKLVKSTTLGRREALSYKIDKAINAAVDEYGSNFGWQIVSYPTANLVFVNVPLVTNTEVQQFAMNVITKSWCNFTGWNANCWAVHNDLIYFGGDGIVDVAWTGLNDKTVAITGSVQAAYTRFSAAGNKHVTLLRPNILISGATTISVRFSTDFGEAPDYSRVAYGVAANPSVWDTALWGTATWASSAETVKTQWISVNNSPGFFLSLQLQVQTSDSSFKWASTDFVVQRGGIL